ncbi:HAD-IIB family hydrolase [Salinisphaera sp. Q1T1-3]|uniref:HAD-IIB family hydrolase n=1 Tax=Salinisphaera sp. Q1T1-3 TaxID=2321229 RepID=UPI001314243F|nr:HAD-IIB family hydrolase [Salinisphaera sp. Q1T1-3]
MLDHPVRLAVFDIDGTLLGPGYPLGRPQIQALARLHEAGITLALASSRQRASLLDLAEAIGLPLYLVSYNGPLVNAPDGTRISATDIALPAGLGSALADFVDAGGCVHCYTVDDWQAFGPDWRIDNEAAGRHAVPSRRAASLTPATLPPRALKILCDGDLPALAAVRAAVAAEPGLVMNWSGSECHDIHARHASKGDGLRQLCRHLSIDTGHTIAFGDADSDISMLSTAGTGFAMGAANARVTAAADRRLGAPGSGELEALLAEIAATV